MFLYFSMLVSYYQILKELVAMQTVSLDAEHKNDIEKIAIYLNAMLQDNGFSSEIIHGYGNPLVFGKFSVDVSLPTMLVYGHYDVHFADMQQWRKNDPFSLYIGKDKIYGRGVADDKWQFLIHLLTIFDLIHTKKLGYNVIVLIEGNEKTWSPYLEQFLSDHRQEFLSDFCLVSDSSLIGAFPCIVAGYRWSVTVRLTLRTADTDLHPWMYWSMVPNAAQEMNKILAKLYDMNAKITIPYFYYDVEDVPTETIVKNKRIKLDEKKIMTDFWLKTIFKDKDTDLLTQIWLKPTIQILWISSGYDGKQCKQAIPYIAYADLHFSTVKNQSSRNVLWAFDQRLQTTLPPYVEYELDVWSVYEPVKIDTNNFYIKKAESVLQHIFGQPVFHTYAWGWLPVVDILARVLWIKSVVVPLVNQDCNTHGINENFDVELIEKWFQFAYEFLKK